MPRNRIPKPHPPDTDTRIFRDKMSWVSVRHIAERLTSELSITEIESWIRDSGFPIPFILKTTPATADSGAMSERFYRSDFVLALFGLEGQYCLYCVKPLKRRQYQHCSRTCVSRYDQWDELTVNLTLPVSGHAALKLFRCALLQGMVPQGLGGVLLKDRVEIYHMRHADEVLIKHPKRWDGRKVGEG